jgi:hypothetical protein
MSRNRITFYKRWCPGCNQLQDETRWKSRRHFYECIDCHTEVRIGWKDRLDDLLERLEPPIDRLDTLVYELGYQWRRVRQAIARSREAFWRAGRDL